jgi:hypothetical protein
VFAPTDKTAAVLHAMLTMNAGPSVVSGFRGEDAGDAMIVTHQAAHGAGLLWPTQGGFI